MTVDELAYAIWKLILDRPVDDRTSKQVFEYAEWALANASRFVFDMQGVSAEEFAGSVLPDLPPTYAEVATYAFMYYMQGKYQNAEMDWEVAYKDVQNLRRR